MSINSLRPSDTFMLQCARPSVVQIMIYHLFGAKPLSESMLDFLYLVFGQKRKERVSEMLIHAPHTHIVAFWYISNIPQGFHSQMCYNTPIIYIAAIFVKYCSKLAVGCSAYKLIYVARVLTARKKIIVKQEQIILKSEIHRFSCNEINLKMSSAKWRPFGPGLKAIMCWRVTR